MPDTAETRGLLEKNSDIRLEMAKRKDFSPNAFFFIEGKEEYQDTFNSDSKLYNFGAEKYMSLMTLNAYLNQDRHLGDKYITPSLTEFYGSNPQITGNIGYYDIYKAHNGFFQRENGRIVDDYNNGVHFIKVEGDDLKDERYYFLRRNLKLADKIEHEDVTDNPETTVLGGRRYYSKDWVESVDKDESAIAIKNERFYGVELEKDIDSVEKERKEPSITQNRERIIRLFTTLQSQTSNSQDSPEGEENVIKGYTKTILSVTQGLFENGFIKTPENTSSKTLKNKKGEYSRSWDRKKVYSDSIKNFAGNFKKEEGGLYTIEDIQEGYSSFRPDNGAQHLSNNSVLEKTGFINIVRRVSDGDDSNSIKKCMFSIENLAWKDVPKNAKEKYLSDEQIGPNGGRIMWFPPYDISFDESVNVNWNSNTFIGRGEKVYTYTDTERNATLSFLLLIDHPNIINETNKNEVSEEFDNDILRFFNGEQLLQARNQANLSGDEKEKGVTPTGSTRTFKQDKTKIEFSIYFPNNYSGMYLYDDNEVLDEGKFKRSYHEYLDKDWWVYLLIGRNTGIPKWNEEDQGWVDKPVYPSEWRGYEIAGNKGLTDLSEEDAEPILPVIDNTYLIPWQEPYSGAILTDTGESYYYRIDYDMRERLSATDGYYDLSQGFMLNNYVVPSTSNNLSDSDSDGIHFSSAEALAAIANHNSTNTGNTKYTKLIDYVTGGSGGMRPNIEEIIEKINNHEIEGIDIVSNVCPMEGSNEKNAKILATRRLYAVRDFLEVQLRDKEIPYFTVNINDKNSETQLNEDVSTEENKRLRRVDVVIKLKSQNIDKLSDIAVGLVTNSDGSTGTTNNYTYNSGDSTNSESAKDTSDKKVEEKENVAVTTNSRRYETESEYFKKLEEEDPMAFKMISERLSYFSPAFHSISPEGFNARLTFIQQCTRQGHTIENSDTNGFAQSAGNLAFGRMPVCVLTLGDFINSRVLINSVSINYSDDGIQWDLNKTGVGVQPMFAKITLQMHILGGQSLQGPVSRLQNAVSFNYYANAGVYDDRADRVSINPEDYKENYEKGTPWVPYPEGHNPKTNIE